MSLDEAKFLLSASRPNGRDCDNPAMADALKQAQTDPALREWLQRSMALDSAVSGKLADIQPPAGLRDAIVAGARAAGPVNRFVHVRLWITGIAAALLVLFATQEFSALHARSEQKALAQFALSDLTSGRFGGRGKAADELQARLEAGGKLPGADSIDLARLESTGCRTVKFGNRNVAEVCFLRGRLVYHFYVAKRDAGPSPVNGPVFVANSFGAAAAWSDARFDYALTSADGIGSVQELL